MKENISLPCFPFVSIGSYRSSKKKVISVCNYLIKDVNLVDDNDLYGVVVA